MVSQAEINRRDVTEYGPRDTVIGDIMEGDGRQGNKLRALWAQEGLKAFAQTTGLDIETDGWDTVVKDFLGDLRHFCDTRYIDFEDIVERASDSYADEVYIAGGRIRS